MPCSSPTERPRRRARHDRGAPRCAVRGGLAGRGSRRRCCRGAAVWRDRGRQRPVILSAAKDRVAAVGIRRAQRRTGVQQVRIRCTPVLRCARTTKGPRLAPDHLVSRAAATGASTAPAASRSSAERRRAGRRRRGSRAPWADGSPSAPSNGTRRPADLLDSFICTSRQPWNTLPSSKPQSTRSLAPEADAAQVVEPALHGALEVRLEAAAQVLPPDTGPCPTGSRRWPS